MQLQHPLYFIALLSLPVLWWLYSLLTSWKKKTAARIGDPALVNQLTNTFSAGKFRIKFLVVLFALFLLVAGMANPRMKGEAEKVSRQGVDVMIVMDVSKSMLAKDVKPSRLDKAKQLLFNLLDRLPNDRIGIILFAGRAYMQMPLTTDHGAAKMYISDAGPQAVPTQGTEFSEALQMAAGSFNRNEHKYKAVVLISDGEDHDPEGIKTAKKLAEDGIMVNTVGIGSPEGSMIIDPETNEPKKDENGNVIISKLNEPELQNIAAATSGGYIRLDNIGQATNEITRRLDSIEKRSLTENEYVNYRNFFTWFAGAALVLLLLEWFIPERKKSTL